LRYRVTSDSIAGVNGLDSDTPIVIGQELQIPWPTATPPLVPVAVQIGGEVAVADPAGCEMVEIQSGDSLFSIAARNRVDLNALMLVNRLTDQTVVQPGDRICIPAVIFGLALPPTPGPSPTPTATPAPLGPQLLYPPDQALVEPADGPLALQWAAVKDLTQNEWYMVEVTDLTDVDSHPRRAFTRQTSLRVPADWRPTDETTHQFRWRVSVILVTGRRADGGFIYTFGGRTSADAFFAWRGAMPTPTATPTPSPTPQS
jgi:LysM repeat protein